MILEPGKALRMYHRLVVRVLVGDFAGPAPVIADPQARRAKIDMAREVKHSLLSPASQTSCSIEALPVFFAFERQSHVYCKTNRNQSKR